MISKLDCLPVTEEMEDAHPINTWEEIVTRKRAIRDEAIRKYLPGTWENSQSPWPSREERTITDIAELGILQEKIQSGEATAEAVIKAYIKRCATPTRIYFRCILTLL